MLSLLLSPFVLGLCKVNQALKLSSGQLGWGFGKAGLMEGVSVHDRALELDGL